MKALYIAAQDNKDRHWATVGRLTRDNGVYKFVYTRGAESMRDFRPFGRMDDLHIVYQSDQLFPIFSNRILAKGRPEFEKYTEWLGLSKEKYDEFEELARTGGLRATDSLELFSCPEPTSNKNYVVHFFCRGLSHFHEENQKRASRLNAGEQLFITQDLQNPHDPMALLMRTGDPITLVGYAPRFYSADFTQLIRATRPDQVKVTIERINNEAPIQYKVLCKLESLWPSNFKPFANEEFVPLA